LGIVKGMVGPAILYLPHGFANAGWVIAVPMLFASTALYLASSASLLECWEVESKNNKRLLMEGGGGDNIGEGHDAELEMKELRKSNVGGNGTDEDFDNEFLEGALVADVTRKRFTASAITPSYPNLAKKAFGSRGQTLVKIGIAASEYLLLVRSVCFCSILHRFESSNGVVHDMILTLIHLKLSMTRRCPAYVSPFHTTFLLIWI
jgi:hypothetical protein